MLKNSRNEAVCMDVICWVVTTFVLAEKSNSLGSETAAFPHRQNGCGQGYPR